jgi:signal transduction histidine kinase
MSTISDQLTRNADLTQRERELGAIIDAYNHVTEQLKQSHERLRDEVVRLREELANKNRQLRRRERLAALGEMAAGVAHEIRNPLAGIQLFASLLEKDLREQPASLRLASKIAKGVGTVEAIVTDFLEFGRPRDPEPATVRVATVVREVIELSSSRAAEQGVEITCDDTNEAELLSDSAMLKRALLNLVLNAVDAAGRVSASDKNDDAGVSQVESAAAASGRVAVSVRRHPPEHVTISVEDNGPGVPAELMDRIFNPFFTTKDRGTGLGLAIVHQIAESLGGNVQVANAAAGGAVFSICLPEKSMNV